MVGDPALALFSAALSLAPKRAQQHKHPALGCWTLQPRRDFILSPRQETGSGRGLLKGISALWGLLKRPSSVTIMGHGLILPKSVLTMTGQSPPDSENERQGASSPHPRSLSSCQPMPAPHCASARRSCRLNAQFFSQGLLPAGLGPHMGLERPVS